MIRIKSRTSLIASREEKRRRSGIWTASQAWSLLEVARSSIAISSSPVSCLTRERTLFLRPSVRRATTSSSDEGRSERFNNVFIIVESGLTGQFLSKQEPFDATKATLTV